LAAEDHRIKNKLFHGENFQRVQAALTQLEPIANRYSCSLAQLSLAWLIKQPQTNAIAGVRNAAQAVNNAQAMTINLTPEDLKLIDNIGKQVTDFLDDNPVLWDF